MKIFKILIILVGIYIGFYFFSVLGAIVTFVVLSYFLYPKPNDWDSKYDSDLTWSTFNDRDNKINIKLPKNRKDRDSIDTLSLNNGSD